ncbi:Npt1/Npt2 family nucleotide transporter [Sphingomonas sp. CROZ-RG-20F-R02-07]|uniref:Npt1/Npt2 family nucleotide transporter n=1 Tax=Sphingomonas sp. CROZ-RG-20F-R02-07 TaxID=2914832 RepID=UPI001F5A676B|nr:Npt1/Npt2 family nucleotide transporter [Sphingomonas sp. CROZ-RG-20F-R02-07]
MSMAETQTLPAPSAGWAARMTPEIKLTILLFFFSFFIAGVPRVFTQNASYSLFIAAYGAKAVPYAYIAQAICVPIGGWIYLMGEHRLKLRTLILTTLCVNASVLVLFRIGLYLQVPLVAGATMVWFEIEFVLSSLLLWGLANQLMTLRQGKRLFGFIVAGEPVAVIVCGLGTSLLMRFLTTPDLFLLSAAGAIIGFFLVLYITANYAPPADAAGGEEEHAPAEGEPAAKAWWKESYILVMIGMIVASQLIFFFNDETFYIAVDERYHNEEAIASFLGVYSAVMGSISLAVSLFVAGPLVRRFGVRGGLITLPALLFVGAIVAVVTGQMFGVATALFFVLVTNKVIDQSFRYTLDKTTTITLYQPLPAAKRMKLQAALESMIEPVTGGVAGLLLSFMIHVLGFSAIGVSAVMAAILAAWLGTVFVVSKGYTDVLRRAVAGRQFDFDPDAALSGDALVAIRHGLASRHVGEVLYALHVLGGRPEGLAVADVAPLLAHAEPAVRIEAAQWFEARQDAGGLALVSGRLAQERLPSVRGALIAAIAGSAGEDAVEHVLPYLDAETEAEQVGAYQGLIRHGGIEGVIAAGNRLIADIQSTDANRRQLAADVMQRVGSHLFYRPLLRLLDDPNEEVRAAALAAAGAIHAPQLWPAILDSLKSARLTQPAIAAIGMIGDDMLEPLAALYADPATVRATRRAAIAAAGVIGTPAAATWLMTLIEEGERVLRHAALAALWRIGHKATPAERPRVKAQLHAEVDTAAWMLAAWADCAHDDEGQALVARALSDEIDNTQEAIFHLLGLLVDKVDMHEARLRFVSGGATQRSYVLEMLDNSLDMDVKPAVLPFLEPETLEGRNLSLGKRSTSGGLAGVGGVAETSEARLGAWAPASALYALALIGSEAAEEAVSAARMVEDAVLRETAEWIAGGKTRVGEGRTMLLTIEKVLILRSVGIFSHVRESSLTQAAQSVREVPVKAGQTVFAQGDFGDALYIVASGRLRVHIGDKQLAEIGERQVVGEMAALDPEPRSASVTAIEDSLLLRMSSDNLERLIGDDIRVARGIIHELCDRLRKANTAPAAAPVALAAEPA